MATDLTSTSTITRVIPGRLIQIETPATADNTDYVTITLADYGMASVEVVDTFRHTTTDSVIVPGDNATTAVSSGDLTITIGGSTSDKKRVFHVWGNPS